MAVFFNPSHLPVIRNITPHQIVAGTIPGRPLCPPKSGTDTLDCCSTNAVLTKFLFEGNNIRIGIPHWLLAGPVPGRDGLPVGRKGTEPRQARYQPLNNRAPAGILFRGRKKTHPGDYMCKETRAGEMSCCPHWVPPIYPRLRS